MCPRDAAPGEVPEKATPQEKQPQAGDTRRRPKKRETHQTENKKSGEGYVGTSLQTVSPTMTAFPKPGPGPRPPFNFVSSGAVVRTDIFFGVGGEQGGGLNSQGNQGRRTS